MPPPSAVKMTIGATTRPHRRGLIALTRMMTLIHPTARTPASGPMIAAHTTCGALTLKVGDLVGRVAGEHDPGNRRGDRAGDDRGYDHRQRERAEQHLDGEQRAAQRHVVDRCHARTGAAGDQQTPLPGRKLGPVRQQCRYRGARQLGGGLRVPSDAPIPTMTIDSTPRAWLFQKVNRPPPSHSASEISPAPEPRTRLITSPPIPAITPASNNTTMCWRGSARSIAPR